MKFPLFLPCTAVFFAYLTLGEPKAALALDVPSPNGRLVLTFEVKDMDGDRACPCYRVACEGRTVLAESRLGLDLDGGPMDRGLAIVNSIRSQRDATWKPVCGERDSVRDHFHELRVDLRQTESPHRMLQMTFRAYDEGIAFCYTLPAQDGLKDFAIVGERTSFRFSGDPTAWAVYAAQGNYDGSEMPLSKVRPGAERPLTVRIADDLYAALTEARLVDYARMKLRPAKGEACTMEALLDVERGTPAVTGTTPFTSPWRVVLVAQSPGRLLEQNDLVLNLNDPCALKDTSWIKPGKVLREVTLTTAGGKACVDFCVRRGLQYVEYDAGWYGHEYDPKADARAVHLDPKRNPDPTSLDLHEVIRYADSKGIGVILYVNHLALEKQLDEILPLYQKWGIKGVKYGFVNVGSQRWTRWLHEAIRKAAACRLMVDIHDEFRSTGFQRTYPNLMTVEGILGNEGFPTPVHNATLPFTRFLTGPGDYTFCWQSPRLKPTHAHQLALSTIYFSPWQFLYWYDRPSMIREEQALDYWTHLPTVWDETRVLRGEIGREVSVARRKGDEWYLGTIRAVGRGTMEIPLSFLKPGRSYEATVYSDRNPLDPASKEVKVETVAVDSTTILKADIPANGGQAVRIVPKRGASGGPQTEKANPTTDASPQAPAQVPGVVIDHSPKSSGIYIGSPSIAILPGGDYVASHDEFGPKSTERQRAITRVFRSSDKGKTWTHAGDILGQFWSNLFVHRGDLYILGAYSHYGNAVIRKSKDGGRTWTEPKDAASGLLFSGRYHCAPMPVVEHAGRLWRAMEDTTNPRRWGLPFRAMMLSAPSGADLLRAESWTCTNPVAGNPAWLDGTFNGWLEGNAVVTPEGRIVDVLRVDCPSGGKAAIVDVSASGREATFDPATGFVDFPGGAKKFTIRYDAESKRYWSLANFIPPKHRGPRAGGVRNTLALTSSADLHRWTVNGILLYHPDVIRHGFQYPDWQFDGEDIIAAVRTAYDDGLGGAHNAHDANYLTFHRVRAFRRLTLADSVVRPDSLGIEGGTKDRP